MTTLVHRTELPRLPPREPQGHKGTYGRVLVIAGSRGMAGAAGLAGMGALRGGAGLVTVACPAEIAGIVAGYEPSYLTRPIPGDPEGRFDRQAAAELLALRADVVALGPGLGQSDSLADLVAELIGAIGVPLVIDADGLNLLAGRLAALARRPQATVLTPHVGEFARLAGCSTAQVLAGREERAADFAREHGVVLVLKGHRTLVTDGQRLAVNHTGNPGMATGGAGDVLTGLVSALIGQGLAPFEAAWLAVHLHGLAGDIVAQRASQVSLIARDLVDGLPAAFQHEERARCSPGS